ncbi:50S ribosomal protein P1 [Saccharolobus solfataricus]|uniref:Large ribosomal subunit protein P1 n=3 Tax=Saccharolobus solfataricus TaxID=2287 RepID=RL12_SACS2|nr:50S ribosomal protein P1 [Saccharolobus solfataricus]P96040.1 RecName: Full=Large ribosomal subunit protein P1; AltName: Full=50S ribosomal protein L12 [Saccharolobus solfataricus P2]AAB99527.1 ribosomal protein L12 [Saccharolobus solfataricus]AAK40672.1 LSU ribosomal protein L12AB (rpl12AB) [Saccharolobus solfataricus P2]AKA73650.1 50S ribosomal protein P1 [Saccharolobus solfataricus]AKA76347.1 50S ribosomal protein P1 [Saccharolobus solfataricus]AKA79039.1 50S ribosomal protein P1 [Sacch
MEYIYASLLLHSAKKEISEDALKNVLTAAGISVDEVRLKAVVAALKEVNIDEVLKNAAAMPVAVAAQPQATQAQPAAEEKKEEKKEEEKKGPSEEEIASGLASLFG